MSELVETAPVNESNLLEFLKDPVNIRPSTDLLTLVLPDQETVLTHCIKNQMVDAVDSLLTYGADPNLSNQKGVTPISAAAHKGNIVIMHRLIIAGAAVNAVNAISSWGTPALTLAAHFGHLHAVKLLLTHNAAFDFANMKGTTALMRACQEGHLEIVKALLEGGADPNRKNYEGMNALILASQRGHSDIVKVLVESGSSLNEQTTQGSTALILACKRGHARTVETLMSLGADVNIVDCRGRTARIVAQRRDHPELLEWLGPPGEDEDVSAFKVRVGLIVDDTDSLRVNRRLERVQVDADDESSSEGESEDVVQSTNELTEC